MPAEPFPVLDVSSWDVSGDETVGHEEKAWLVHPETGEDWLFKPVTVKNGHVQGEDWAEKLASRLARRIQVPCADVEMAVRSGDRGSVSRDLRPRELPDQTTWQMQPGLVVLADGFPDYQPGTGNPPGRPGHCLTNIRSVLKDTDPPPGASVPVYFTAFDIFVGYLMLDAWIANRDRHDENWSVLLPLDPDSRARLSGSYDQAGSLSYNMREEERLRRLGRANGVTSWATRGTAYRFEHTPGKPVPTLVELAAQGLAMVAPGVRDFWIGQLAGVTATDERDLVERVPGLSEAARMFVLKLLEVNRGRLLDECR